VGLVLLSLWIVLLGLSFVDGWGSQLGHQLVIVLWFTSFGHLALCGSVSVSCGQNLPGSGGLGVLCATHIQFVGCGWGNFL